MLVLYYAPRTRAVRIRWLLEELGTPHELRRVEFKPPSKMFTQDTPLGKLPVIDDDGVLICESGAIVEYILERHGDGLLAPAVGSPQRGPFLQWIHFAEGTAFQPVGTLVWHTFYKGDADQVPTVVETARERAHAGFAFVDEALGDREFLLGEEFSAADIMMGFTLGVAEVFELLDDRYPSLVPYLARLKSRPAFQRATAD